MLTLKNITFSFNRHTILHDINAQAQPGDIILIIGHNGSGKSTLLNIIAGTRAPEHGTITINEHDITRMGERQRALLMSRLHQNPTMNTAATLTVAHNLSLAQLKGKRALLRNGSIDTHNIAEEMRPLLHKRMCDLSGGQRQLIAFNMTTLMQPPILLLDEPTAALDPQATQTLLVQIKKYASNKKAIVIMVTHELEHVEFLGNKLWILNNGTLRIIDKQKELVSPQTLKELLCAPGRAAPR